MQNGLDNGMEIPIGKEVIGIVYLDNYVWGGDTGNDFRCGWKRDGMEV